MPTTTLPTKTLKHWTPKFRPGDIITAVQFARGSVHRIEFAGLIDGTPHYRLTACIEMDVEEHSVHEYPADLIEDMYRLVEPQPPISAEYQYVVETEQTIEHAHEVGTWVQQTANSKPWQIENVTVDVNGDAVYQMRNKTGGATCKAVERVDANWLLAPRFDTTIRLRSFSDHSPYIGVLEGMLSRFIDASNRLDADIEVQLTSRSDVDDPQLLKLWRNERFNQHKDRINDYLRGRASDDATTGWRQR